MKNEKQYRELNPTQIKPTQIDIDEERYRITKDYKFINPSFPSPQLKNTLTLHAFERRRTTQELIKKGKGDTQEHPLLPSYHSHQLKTQR